MQDTTTSGRAAGYKMHPLPDAPLFYGLNPERFTTLQNLHSPQRRLERDTQLVRARDPGAPLITISRGWAFRYSLLPDGRRQVLNFVLPGETIGLASALTGAPVYPAQTATEVVCAMIPHEHVADLLRDQEWFRQRALDALVRERAEAELFLARLGQCTAEERLAAALLDFYNRLASRGLAASDTFMLDLTQQHLADYLGLTVVHLGRVLGRLRGRGLLATSGHRVTLLDVLGLERLALNLG